MSREGKEKLREEALAEIRAVPEEGRRARHRRPAVHQLRGAVMAESQQTPAGGVEPARSQISDEEVAALLEKTKEASGGVRPYDFAAQRINRTQLPLLEAITKTLAVRQSASLSALASAATRSSISMPWSPSNARTCMGVAALAGNRGRDPHEALGRIRLCQRRAGFAAQPAGRLFSGARAGLRAPTPKPALPAGGGNAFLTLMVKSCGADVTAAWQPVSPIELEFVKHETNPRLVKFGAAMESVVVCKFNVEFAARTGTISWLYPDSLLAPLREALSGDTGGSAPRKQEPWGPALSSALKEAQLDTRAVLAEAQISLRELVQLSPGDIIPIETPQQATLFAGEVPLYLGRFGVSQGHNALKIIAGGSKT